jgi:hypothetical protein
VSSFLYLSKSRPLPEVGTFDNLTIGRTGFQVQGGVMSTSFLFGSSATWQASREGLRSSVRIF